jgi:hypothetical protein
MSQMNRLRYAQVEELMQGISADKVTIDFVTPKKRLVLPSISSPMAAHTVAAA